MSIEERKMPVTGRGLDAVLDAHGLPLSAFAGETIYDLGCGRSDLQAELSIRGVRACVIGFDNDDRALDHSGNSATQKIFAELDDLPVEDESADIVIATYSLPMWGKDPEQIQNFYAECTRIVKINGLLSVYPISAALGGDLNEEALERLSAAVVGAMEIRRSQDWLSLNQDRESLTVRKIQ
jgi:ubiquinone/menaquinone biosynthesis C-methylase UbiE